MSKLTYGTVVSLILGWSLPGYSQATGQIAFQSSRDGPDDDRAMGGTGFEYTWEIYAMGADGSGQRNLTNHSSWDIDPAWSPDGTQIAFASDRRGSFQIFTMGPDGSNPLQLTHGPGDHVWPAWSPDGAQLAFSSDEQGEGDFDIYVMEADGGEQVNVTQVSGADYAPSWSPDGTQLSFSSNRDRIPENLPGMLDRFGKLYPVPNDIFVMDALGGAATNLTRSFEATTNLDPVWAPRGRNVAYVLLLFGSAREWDVDIVWTSATGGGRVELGLSEAFNLRTPSWSRDGLQLAYSSTPFTLAPGWEIFVVSTAGGQPVRLTQSGGDDMHPTWSPASPTDTNVDHTTWGAVKSLFRGDKRVPE